MKRLLLVVALASACMAQGRLGGKGRVSGSGRLGAGGGGASTTSRSFSSSTDVLSNTQIYNNGASVFTQCAWFKSGNTAASNTYISKINLDGPQIAWIYGFASSGGLAQIEFFTSGGGSDFRTGSQITISDTSWHHICYRSDGTEWAYFFDGVKHVINAALSGTLPSGTGPGNAFSIGASGSTAAMSMARYYISTAALTDMQIGTMAGPTCSTSGVSGTVGYWPLGQASPDPESSPSPNTNSLTVTGATVSTGPSCSGS